MGRLDRTHRRARAVLLWAVLEVALAVIGLLVKADRDAPAPRPAAGAAARPAASAPSTTVVVTGTPPPSSAPAAPTTAPPAGRDASSDPGAAASAPAPPPTTAPVPTDGVVSAPAVAVSCHPDVSLEASPDAPYSFLCTRGTTPISWPSDSIRLFTQGLTPAQTAALPLAIAQWESNGRFNVALVNALADANVVMTGAPLDSNEDGYTSMHYVCAAKCVYDHADVQLATNAELTKTSWVSTILHELGHVAGLNHVARHSEVMYPEIDADSPAAYGSGDLAGLQELQKVRSAV